MNSSRIIGCFNQEFSVLRHIFHFIELKVSEVKESNVEYVYHPGVYVFFDSKKVIKVGRHLSNSRKRALEHISDNTAKGELQMKSWSTNTDAKLLLLNVIDPKDYHWVAALEIYLENMLKPAIPSKRH